jgi:hypothetical protein
MGEGSAVKVPATLVATSSGRTADSQAWVNITNAARIEMYVVFFMGDFL